MGFTPLEKDFWILGFVGHLLLLLVLLIRRRCFRFPIFTSLIGYQLLISPILFLVSRHGTPHAYFVAYWLCAAGDFGLQLALVAEIAASICRMNGSWIKAARGELWTWATAGMAVAAVACLLIAPPLIAGLDLWDLRTTLFSSLLICQLVLGVSMTANRLRLQRSRHVMSLGQGLALWAAIAVVGDALKVATGWRHEFAIFDQIRMCVYLLDLGFWTFSFCLPERKPALFLDRVSYTTVLPNAAASLVKHPATLGDLQ